MAEPVRGILSGLPDLDGPRRVRETYPVVEAHEGRIVEHRASGLVGFVVRAKHGVVVLRDRRGSPREALRLDGWQASAYLGCDAAISLGRLRRQTGVPVDDEELRGFLDWLVDHQLMLRQDDRYLALAVHTPPRLDVLRPRDEQRAEAFV